MIGFAAAAPTARDEGADACLASVRVIYVCCGFCMFTSAPGGGCLVKTKDLPLSAHEATPASDPLTALIMNLLIPSEAITSSVKRKKII